MIILKALDKAINHVNVYNIICYISELRKQNRSIYN